ncbi:recombination-associated protein RdgC [Tepidimonas sp.]|uniref:recombination-associated protein RdgC n=1 Tax=Tepidimonas sp. TaxID=2002775 RepID=UPI0028CDAE4A|nr:recombination-associated protein RdgC [Tepidimonas sp.]MDT7929078.1 recombination-associated protein RdgC [Tepidimonas sp.]
MFKNLTVFRLGDGFAASLEQMEQALAALPFHPCGPTEMRRRWMCWFGWTSWQADWRSTPRAPNAWMRW